MNVYEDRCSKVSFLALVLLFGLFFSTIGVTASERGTLKWKTELRCPLPYSPAVGSDGTIYVGTKECEYKNTNIEGYLYALNSDGTVQWYFNLKDDISSSPTLNLDGTIIVTSGEVIYAISPNGALNWSKELSGQIESSPAIGENGTIYVSSSSSRRSSYLYAFNSVGKVKWKYEVDETWIQSSSAIARDGTIYFKAYNNLYALNPDGTLKWEKEFDQELSSAPIISDRGTIYISSEFKGLFALSPRGRIKWKVDPGRRDGVFHPVIGENNIIYAFAGRYNNKNFCAIEPGGQLPTGTLKWLGSVRFGANHKSYPTVGEDGTIYFGSLDNYIWAVNPDRTLKWRYETNGEVESYPVIIKNGILYIGSNDGFLYALNVESSGLANSSWPMFQRNLRHTGNLKNLSLKKKEENQVP